VTGRRPTTATIDLAALRANVAEARRLAGGHDLIAVVKADGYGHGAVRVARAALEAGCPRLAVLSVAEAAELREAAVAAPILVLGGVHDAREAESALALRVTPVLHERGALRQLADAARRTGSRGRVQVEVDTGMRRMGVAPGTAVSFLEEVSREPFLELEGVFTHFAQADELDLEPTLAQLARFRQVLREAKRAGVEPPLIHAANSAGLLAGRLLREALPEATAVRPGLMLYGARPGDSLPSGVSLQPVMHLRNRVVQIQAVDRGEAVGYGATFRAPAPTRVATLAVGYADGVACASGNRGAVWLAGASRPIVGRVSMDYIGVDIGADPVKIGDEAVVFGRGADGGVPVEQAAAAAGTISYELLVRVGQRVPREER
jgi:alanine racemase